MADKKGYNYVLEAPPKRAGRGKSDFYPNIVADFVKSGDSNWKITDTGRKPTTLYIGLGKASKEGDGVPVRVEKRGDNIFLVRTDIDEAAKG